MDEKGDGAGIKREDRTIRQGKALSNPRARRYVYDLSCTTRQTMSAKALRDLRASTNRPINGEGSPEACG